MAKELLVDILANHEASSIQHAAAWEARKEAQRTGKIKYMTQEDLVKIAEDLQHMLNNPNSARTKKLEEEQRLKDQQDTRLFNEELSKQKAIISEDIDKMNTIQVASLSISTIRRVRDTLREQAIKNGSANSIKPK